MPDRSAAPAAAATQADKPLTLIRLAVHMVKGFIKGIPSMLVWTIVRTLLMFLIVLAVHTFFVVVKNDGFWPDANNPVYRMIAFPETRAGALAFWGIAAFLISSLAGRIWFNGPLKLVRDFIDMPVWIIEGFQKAKKAGNTAFLGGIAVVVALSFFVHNPYLMFTFTVTFFFSLTSRQQGMWFLVLTTAWSDLRALAKKERRVNHSAFTVLLFGLLIGLILAQVMPFGLYGRIGVLVLALAGIVLNNLGKLRPKTAVATFVLLFLSAALFRATGVYADDGGWWEAGGTFWDWLNSPGSWESIRMGLGPAAISLLTAFLASGSTTPKPPPIPDVLLDNQATHWEWHREGDKWVIYQVWHGNKYGTGIPESVFHLDPETMGNRIAMYTTPTVDHTAAIEQMQEITENLGTGYMDRFTRNGWKNLSGTERAESLTALSHLIAQVTGVKPGSFTVDIHHDADTGSHGSWNAGTRTLFINNNSSHYDNPLRILQTMCHEMRHAAQSDPSVDMGGDQTYRDLITWNDQNSNYQTPSADYTRYAGQLLERDAESYGDDLSRAFILQAIRTHYGTE